MYSIERFRRPTPSQKYNFPMLLAPKPEGWEDLPPRGRRYSTILPGPSSFHDAKASALLSMFSLHPSPLRVPYSLVRHPSGTAGYRNRGKVDAFYSITLEVASRYWHIKLWKDQTWPTSNQLRNRVRRMLVNSGKDALQPVPQRPQSFNLSIKVLPSGWVFIPASASTGLQLVSGWFTTSPPCEGGMSKLVRKLSE
ncbi:uncharacterized protein MCYG_05796 [Microsporum canis CBS 113480]|uniref:Uncharacterized protein n=1 Tax=Arthroderma otae (strain ATCC MYA-4605 / CBS 113480) TaxID=554155 RepID=C5FSX4_ARTOC|nr:uncharacterized protein MCYG_05796 [Microsporum canis CBS 113480]EEQ32977.1 predicted protein [Microsporum canis CBS 113480]